MYEMDGKSIKKVLMHMIRAQEMIWDVILWDSDLTNVIHTDYYSSFTSYNLMFERDNGQFFVSLKHVKG